jgi:hypothetical protein
MGEHKSRAELVEDLAGAANEVKIGGMYQHFRREGVYKVLGVYIAEATDAVEVRYTPVDEPRLEFGRPLSSWHEPKLDGDGNLVPRFVLVQAAADELGGDKTYRQADAGVDVGAHVIET